MSCLCGERDIIVRAGEAWRGGGLRRKYAGECCQHTTRSFTHSLTYSLPPFTHSVCLSVRVCVSVSLSVSVSISVSLSPPPPPILLPAVTNELSSHPMSLELARCDQSRSEHKMRWGIVEIPLPPSLLPFLYPLISCLYSGHSSGAEQSMVLGCCHYERGSWLGGGGGGL